MITPMPDDSAAPDRAFPLAAADQCVKCGMCLPHCPTYRITLDEAESPRGRIMLMQGLATGMLPASAALEGHLDRCLTCRACERVCPADVPYGQLIDAARINLARRDPSRSRLARAMAFVLLSRTRRALMGFVLWAYQRIGLQALVRATGLLGRGKLARLESLLPRMHLPRLPLSSAGTNHDVMLFANCTSPLVEPQALAAAVQVLEALGCSVRVPRQQTCCGALHQHAGLARDAQACAERNLEAFAGEAPILGIASGCTAQLVEYGHIAPGPAGRAFAERSRDIHAFIATHPALPQLRFEPLAARVLLHTPCTLRNVLRDEISVRALLSRIPGLEIVTTDAACCGAAGSYFLSQPEMSDALAVAKVEQARASQPHYLLTGNVGCAIHLAAALRRGGITVEVMHPLQLLARQLVR